MAVWETPNSISLSRGGRLRLATSLPTASSWGKALPLLKIAPSATPLALLLPLRCNGKQRITHGEQPCSGIAFNLYEITAVIALDFSPTKKRTVQIYFAVFRNENKIFGRENIALSRVECAIHSDVFRFNFCVGTTQQNCIFNSHLVPQTASRLPASSTVHSHCKTACWAWCNRPHNRSIN